MKAGAVISSHADPHMKREVLIYPLDTPSN